MSDRNAAAGVGDRVGDDSAGKGNLSHTGGLFGGLPTLLLIVSVTDNKPKFKKKDICVILAIGQRMPVTLRCSEETRSVDQWSKRHLYNDRARFMQSPLSEWHLQV